MKELKLSSSDKIFGGVCGGLANYFDLKSDHIRMVLAFLSFIRYEIMLLYILCWAFLPQDMEN